MIHQHPYTTRDLAIVIAAERVDTDPREPTGAELEMTCSIHPNSHSIRFLIVSHGSEIALLYDTVNPPIGTLDHSIGWELGTISYRVLGDIGIVRDTMEERNLITVDAHSFRVAMAGLSAMLEAQK